MEPFFICEPLKRLSRFWKHSKCHRDTYLFFQVKNLWNIGIRKRKRFTNNDSRVIKSVTYRFFLTERADTKTTAAPNYTLEFGVVLYYVTFLRCDGLHCVSFKFVVWDLWPHFSILDILMLLFIWFKVAQNSFQHIPRRRFLWVMIATLDRLMPQS